jgi:hypothetical protein
MLREMMMIIIMRMMMIIIIIIIINTFVECMQTHICAMFLNALLHGKKV